ncbi:DUF4336 domain-containing protein [Erythrobacter sp. T5W1-R]|uniref:DUF4336 domain-containing protein n=1 Tax=Erythrobacter sp. T5W1-R TaxID=3101752 RepID=UPI002AFF909B|nr:DUF4336 domain-containing protein [Erythrobacter sp. T5W1-R]MEA1617656.1 DUF4336 domain-containing protein [Erythrobacter sp. T5W1-R]
MTSAPGYLPYEPQLQPVPWAQDIWTVNGPEVAYRLWGLTLPCPTRMTIIRLPDGALWLHSPVACVPDLVAAVEALGPIAAIIAPNVFHYTHLADWARAFPQARVFGLPGLAAKVPGIAFTALDQPTTAHWAGLIESHVVALGDFAEVVFLHRASRTLIVTDLMQNFEAGRIRNPLVRTVLQLGGATGPNGRPSIEIRLVALAHRNALREGVEQMLAWEPSGIILSHGACYRKDATTEIAKAFGRAGSETEA